MPNIDEQQKNTLICKPNLNMTEDVPPCEPLEINQDTKKTHAIS